MWGIWVDAEDMEDLAKRSWYKMSSEEREILWNEITEDSKDVPGYEEDNWEELLPALKRFTYHWSSYTDWLFGDLDIELFRLPYEESYIIHPYGSWTSVDNGEVLTPSFEIKDAWEKQVAEAKQLLKSPDFPRWYVIGTSMG